MTISLPYLYHIFTISFCWEQNPPGRQQFFFRSDHVRVLCCAVLATPLLSIGVRSACPALVDILADVAAYVPAHAPEKVLRALAHALNVKRQPNHPLMVQQEHPRLTHSTRPASLPLFCYFCSCLSCHSKTGLSQYDIPNCLMKYPR